MYVYANSLVTQVGDISRRWQVPGTVKKKEKKPNSPKSEGACQCLYINNDILCVGTTDPIKAHYKFAA